MVRPTPRDVTSSFLRGPILHKRLFSGLVPPSCTVSSGRMGVISGTTRTPGVNLPGVAFPATFLALCPG